MSERVEGLQGAGRWVQRIAVQVVAATLVLVIFVGLGLLVYRGEMDDGALIFFSGIVVG